MSSLCVMTIPFSYLAFVDFLDSLRAPTHYPVLHREVLAKYVARTIRMHRTDELGIAVVLAVVVAAAYT